MDPLLDHKIQRRLGRIDLYEESVFLTRFSKNGPGEPISCHEVSAADLAAAFAGLPISSPLLPPGCLHWQRMGGQDRFTIYHPPGLQQVIINEHGKRTILTIPLPGLIWQGAGTNYKVWAVKQRPQGSMETMFNAPFPNVYLRNGLVCWGDVTPPAAGADTVHRALQLFLEADFNADLANHRSQKYPNDVRLLWRELDEEQPKGYPLEDLASAMSTFGEITGGN